MNASHQGQLWFIVNAVYIRQEAKLQLAFRIKCVKCVIVTIEPLSFSNSQPSPVSPLYRGCQEKDLPGDSQCVFFLSRQLTAQSADDGKNWMDEILFFFFAIF